MIQFVLKVLGISLALAIAIKYGAPFLKIPATSFMALVLVLVPNLAMAGLLIWRSQRRSN